MSYVEVLQTVYTLDIETSVQNTINNITIEKLDNTIIELNTGTTNIVMASDIIGLDTYIDNFLDDAEIDCGTP
jgi:hypothetical protein